MSSKTELLKQQRAWASSAQRAVDARDYHATVQDNLYQALSASALKAFSEGSGSELVDRGGSPAKMRALHSSSALAVNFFDYWLARDAQPLFRALGFEENPSSIEFEGQFPTGLVGIPPNLDVVFRFENGKVVGVESKFTEWLTPKPLGKEVFKPKYVEAAKGLWSSKGLPRCQALVVKVQANEERFEYLDVAQLLKHVLGLANQHPARFELLYLFYDCAGGESSAHHAELERFASLVDSGCHFRWASYQEVFRALENHAGLDHVPLLEYLRARYFPASDQALR